MKHTTVARTCAALAFLGSLNAQAPWAEFCNVNPAGQQVGGNPLPYMEMSSTGRFATFITDFPLVPADTNFHYDVYVRGFERDQTIYVGPTAGGGTNHFASSSSLSDTGRYVVFTTYASNLGPVDTNGNVDAYHKDLQTNVITLVSQGAGGAPSNGHSSCAVVSDSGRYVAYRTTSTNIVTVPAGTTQIIYVDLQTGVSSLASCDAAGTAGDNGSDRP